MGQRRGRVRLCALHPRNARQFCFKVKNRALLGIILIEVTESALEQLTSLTRTLPLTVCGSALGRTSGLPTNRWHLIESGHLIAGYDKVHLFTPTAEDASFSAGESFSR